MRSINSISSYTEINAKREAKAREYGFFSGAVNNFFSNAIPAPHVNQLIAPVTAQILYRFLTLEGLAVKFTGAANNKNPKNTMDIFFTISPPN